VLPVFTSSVSGRMGSNGIGREMRAIRLWAVDHERCRIVKEFAKSVGRRLGQGGFGECGVHQLHPAVAGLLVDGKRVVAHPQTRVAALFDVALGTAETEDQEVAQTLLGARQVAGRIHRAEDRVIGDLAVKGANEAREAFFTDEIVDGCLLNGIGHSRWVLFLSLAGSRAGAVSGPP